MSKKYRISLRLAGEIKNTIIEDDNIAEIESSLIKFISEELNAWKSAFSDVNKIIGGTSISLKFNEIMRIAKEKSFPRPSFGHVEKKSQENFNQILFDHIKTYIEPLSCTKNWISSKSYTFKIMKDFYDKNNLDSCRESVFLFIEQAGVKFPGYEKSHEFRYIELERENTKYINFASKSTNDVYVFCNDTISAVLQKIAVDSSVNYCKEKSIKHNKYVQFFPLIAAIHLFSLLIPASPAILIICFGDKLSSIEHLKLLGLLGGNLIYILFF